MLKDRTYLNILRLSSVFAHFELDIRRKLLWNRILRKGQLTAKRMNAQILFRGIHFCPL